MHHHHTNPLLEQHPLPGPMPLSHQWQKEPGGHLRAQLPRTAMPWNPLGTLSLWCNTELPKSISQHYPGHSRGELGNNLMAWLSKALLNSWVSFWKCSPKLQCRQSKKCRVRKTWKSITDTMNFSEFSFAPFLRDFNNDRYLSSF